MDTERRFTQLRADDDGGGISGTLLRYGDTAKVFGDITETIRAGAFGNIDMSLFRLNLMHERSQPIAFADGPNLSLEDGKDSLDLRLRWPDNRWADDAKRGVDSGVLRGLSVEFTLDRGGYEWDDENKRVTVTKGRLLGAGLVDIPAYPDSRLHNRFSIPIPPARSGEFGLIAGRAPRNIGGEMRWNETTITSMVRRRAVRFLPGSLDIATMPITLLHGSFQAPLAATQADSLAIRLTAQGLSWAAKNIVRTQAGNDLTRLMRANLITGWTAGYVADPENVSREQVEIGGLKFDAEIVERALLCDIKLISSGAGGQGDVSMRRPTRRRWL